MPDYVSEADEHYYFESYGSEEELTADNYVVPNEEDYLSADEVYYEESEVEEIDLSVAKPGLWENIRNWKKAQNKYKYKDPKTGQVYEYERRGIYRKDGRTLIPAQAAEYQGRKVKLGKPFRTPKGPKKFSVYVKNPKGNVVKVNFGDPNMKIKKNIPGRRENFRARHNCDNPGPRHKARYWSCRAW